MSVMSQDTRQYLFLKIFLFFVQVTRKNNLRHCCTSVLEIKYTFKQCLPTLKRF